mmetsp:Transcript_23776/g.67681  ORF Transcript_23776/g.67681 Transcript_23776/m.67681 type:complete len:352 (-) Transcript_23776:816-1871(-)
MRGPLPHGHPRDGRVQSRALRRWRCRLRGQSEVAAVGGRAAGAPGLQTLEGLRRVGLRARGGRDGDRRGPRRLAGHRLGRAPRPRRRRGPGGGGAAEVGGGAARALRRVNLHLGDHRRAEGGDDLPRQRHLRGRIARGGAPQEPRLRRRGGGAGALLPAALPHRRHARGRRDPPLRHHLAPGGDVQLLREALRREGEGPEGPLVHRPADALLGRPPRLGEDRRPDPLLGGAGLGGAAAGGGRGQGPGVGDGHALAAGRERQRPLGLLPCKQGRVVEDQGAARPRRVQVRPHGGGADPEGHARVLRILGLADQRGVRHVRVHGRLHDVHGPGAPVGLLRLGAPRRRGQGVPR